MSNKKLNALRPYVLVPFILWFMSVAGNDWSMYRCRLMDVEQENCIFLTKPGSQMKARSRYVGSY